MPFDRKDFALSMKEAQEKKTREAMPALRMIQAAAPVMERLMTQNDAWNRYLGILQGQVVRITALRDDARAKLNAPNLWDPTMMVQVKADALQAEAILGALQFCMELPKALLEDGRRAQEIVSQFEAKDDAQKSAS